MQILWVAASVCAPPTDQASSGRGAWAMRPAGTDCDFRRPLPVEQWEDGVIQFTFLEEGLRQQQDFYLYMVDSEGKVSSAIGPWKRGMGILNDPENKIPLENDGERWVPGKAEADSLQYPGAPPQPGWQNAEGFTRQVSFAINEGDSPLAQHTIGDSMAVMPAVWMGNQPNFDDCTWLEPVRVVEVQPGEIICSFKSEAADPAESVFFFVENEPGIKTEGLMVKATVLGPGPPQGMQWTF